MIVLGSARVDAFGALQSTPAALGGSTQRPYLAVADANAALASAVAAGARIVLPITDEDYGDRGLSCRDR